jgi:TonB family protein
MESGDVQSAVCEVALGAEGCACWQHPFRGTDIRMHSAQLRHLSDEALLRIKSNPKSEIGGILWGRIIDNAVIIEDAQSIPSNGALYNATPSDALNLEQAIRHNRPDGLELVGYFRSHIRDGLCLSAQDQDFITKYLRNPEYVFLLIRPYEMGISVGAFFFWQNGQLQTDGSDLEVPFLALEHHPAVKSESGDHGEKLRLSAPEQQQDRLIPPLHENAAADSSPERWIPEQPRKSPSRSTKRPGLVLICVACLIAIAGATGTVAYFAFPMLKTRVLESTSPAAINPVFGLKVTRGTDGQLDLIWNRSVLERLRAQQASLTITDGSNSKRLTIDSAQLHSGTLTYFPSGSDIQFRLEITLNAGHSVAESVRVILPHATPGTPPAFGEQVIRAERASDSEKQPAVHTNLDSSRAMRTGRTSFKAPAYISPAEVLNSRSDSEQPHAPDLKVDLAAATYATLPSSLPALPEPPLRLPAQASSNASARNVIPTKPPVTKPVTPTTSAIHSINTYTPPRPVREVKPDITSMRYALPAQNGKVEVQVTIDESGHVTNAWPVYSIGKPNSLLANAAIAAARRWIFEPATLHGKPVAAEHRIVFDFRQESQ